jgi:hypothetical protein
MEMRRFGLLLVTMLVAAGVLVPTALAKEGGVELSSTPVGMNPGDPWTPQIQLVEGSPELLAAAKPGVTIRDVDNGDELTFRATRTSDPQVWDVRVVFPEPGWYVVESFDGITGRTYPLSGQWLVQAPTVGGGGTNPARTVPVGGSFPVWPFAAGGAVLVALAAAVAAALAHRRRRPALSPR